ncbi:hypothetical protein [Nitratidesulfovibrio termitidis]|uniref:VgrG-related protein n=1 Tax=Nitratidesulfovibrio termitidis TaxID=42252 RepID=UPI0003FF8E11|nr:hypothetical protein [Nitratidesulfovibrio termitidis]
MKSPEAANLPEEYRALKDDPKAIAAAWPEMARKHPDALAAANEAYIQRTHYQPTLDAFERAGLDTGSEAIKSAAFSMGVHTGGGGFAKHFENLMPSKGELEKMDVKGQLDALSNAVHQRFGEESEIGRRVSSEYVNLKNLHDALVSQGEQNGEE